MKEKLFTTLMQSVGINDNEFKVTNTNFYKRFYGGGDLSLIIGESYMDEEWESNDLENFFRKIMKMNLKNYNKLLFPLFNDYPLETAKLMFKTVNHEVNTYVKDTFKNNQSIKLSKIVGEQHYDIPDILYEYMLDSQRQYTCGYWKSDTNTLEQAQQNKINLLIDKMQIPENTKMNILDIGCGWGGLTDAISNRYPKCRIEGISISKEQIQFANNTYANKNKNLKYYYCDYRDLLNKNKKYDRIISVGMFEHVGIKNYNTFFNVCENILTDDGIFVLHTITIPNSGTYLTGQRKYSCNVWMDTYIFPGGSIPMTEDVLSSSQSQRLMYHHIQNLSISYAKTLKEWYNNFTFNWKQIKKTNPEFFTKKFYKMWEFYLLSCMVRFEKKQMQLSQFVFTNKKIRWNVYFC